MGPQWFEFPFNVEYNFEKGSFVENWALGIDSKPILDSFIQHEGLR